MARRHDPFLKLLYRAGIRDAVTLFFPDLAAHVDWDHLQWIEKEVPILGVSPRAVVADLVGLTRDSEGRDLQVLVHPEIQTRTDTDYGWWNGSCVRSAIRPTGACYSTRFGPVSG